MRLRQNLVLSATPAPLVQRPTMQIDSCEGVPHVLLSRPQ